jgi:tetratricopeptide (TPR) repeat protein
MAGFATSGNQQGMVEVLCSLGAIERRAGRFDAAREHLYRAWKLTKRRGGDDETFVVLELGRLHSAEGDLTSAIDFFEFSLARALRWGDEDLASNLRLFLADAHLRTGDAVRAGDEIDPALDFFRRQQDQAGQAWSWRLLSGVHRLTGDGWAALAHAERAVTTVAGLDLPAEHARALTEFARACLAVGRADDAVRARNQALSWFEGAGFTAEAAEARRIGATTRLTVPGPRRATHRPSAKEQGTR